MGLELKNPLICIVGPTATGKTALAQALAEIFSAAVLSADSMQIYKGMDIGTGKILPEQRTVEYYGLDLIAPNEAYSAALFQDYGRNVVEKRDAQNMRTIVCGGTGFYIRALIDDFDFPEGKQVENSLREQYLTLARESGPDAVWNILNTLDPVSAACIPANDTKRVIRALELHSEGISYAEQKEAFKKIAPFYPSIQIGLQVDVDTLNSRINERVENMLEAGLLDEVRTLISQGYKRAITANQAIGYKELVSYLEGRCSLSEAIEQIKLATRRYAKRQRTWFNKDTRIHWLNANDNDNERLLTESLAYISEVSFDE